MGTLSGSTIKTTYQGLLKTSDAGALTSTLKVIEDGTGVDSALSLSTAAVKVETLEINTVASGSSSTVLVWDSSTKAVSKRPLPIFDPITTTVTSATNPVVTISDASSNSTAITFTGGNGIDITQASNVITIGRGLETINTVSATGSITAADSGKIIYLDAETLDGGRITLPTCAAGLYFKFVLTSDDGAPFKIASADHSASTDTKEYFYGTVSVISLTDDKNASQRVTSSTAAAAEQNHDNLSFDGDAATSGGLVGDVIEIWGTSATAWLVRAIIRTSHTTPSSIAVIGAS
tara:strand:+ start:1368 stop:2243 length:876 start_codon:yes stop_codon:yes gene_type:complete